MYIVLQFFINLFFRFIKNKSFIIPEPVVTSHISRYDLYQNIYESKFALWSDTGVNICGFRDESGLAEGVWNDVISICYRDAEGRGVVEEFIGTTDPGDGAIKTTGEWSYCNKDLSEVFKKSRGAAHLCPGFYRAWKYGKHRGYSALVQTAGKVKVWADFNIADPTIWKLENNIRKDFCGINIHYGLGKENRIWMASQGCQVIQGMEQWKRFIFIIEMFEKKEPGRIYSYLLIDKKDYPRREIL